MILKIVKTDDGIQLFNPYKNTFYNFSHTSWKIIKLIKKYGRDKAVNRIMKLFDIDKKNAIEDIQTVLANIKLMDINIDDIPLLIQHKKYIPRMVQFDVTPRCNSNCIYCFSSDLMSKKDELSTEKIFEVIKELNNQGLWIITISGGEPLLRSDIFKILDLTAKLNIVTWLNTNAILIDNETAKKLSKFSNLFVQVSLDSSNPNHHDKLRGKKGSFNKTIKGIKNLMKYKINPRISTTVTPINFNDVKETVDFLYNIGIRSIRIGNARSGAGRGLINKDQLYLNINQLKLLGEIIINSNKKYKGSIEFSTTPEMYDKGS
jgi:MoaA/NifB/PqqE/SkfB family radical SAM enzyme